MVKKESSEISKNTSLKPEALLNIMQDLEKEKKKFENLFENSADAIFITDIGEKKITDCNKKALDITGYNKEEIIGMHPKYLHPKEIREESMKVFEKYNKSESMRYETRLLTKQGKKIPISISTSIIELESEKIAVGLFRDISDRKKAEEQLKHKEELERIISEISNNLINTGEEGIDKQLENVLEKIGRFSEAGRSYIFQFSDDMKNMNNTHEWTAEDVEPQKDNLQKLSTPKFPWMMKKIKNFETIRVSKLSELPSETETFRKHLKKQNIKSLLVVPLVSNNNLKGLIGFDWIEKEGEWSGEIINLLRIVGEIIAGVLDRKEKREKIEEERKRIKRYLETAEVMILGLDIEGNVIEANRKATEILGYDKEEIIGKNWLDNFIPKRFRKEIRNIHKEAIKKKSFAKNYENPVLTKSGKERIINWKNRFFTNSEGKVTGTLSSGMDVTKKRKQEEKLKESEKRLSQIFKGISVPTFVIDKEHNVIRWNKACEKLTGISREEIEGTKKQWKSFYNKKRPVLADLIVDEASEEKFNKYYQDKWKKFPLIKGAYKAEDFFQNIGGKERWIFFTASPIKNSKGEITGAIETLQDITQRKEREDSLQRLVDITSETTGEEFFDSLVKKLVDWFDADGAFVGRLSEDEKMVSSISMFLNEKKVENYEYPLSGSPCEKITEKGISLYRENVTKKFPKDKDLKKLGVEGYLGAPIRKENGKTKGILWVISKNKFEKLPVKWKDLLKIITSRAAAEIERKDKEELLKFEKERFQQIFDNVNDALYLHEIGEKGEPGKFVEVNQVACDMLGYSKGEFMKMSPDDIDSEENKNKMPEVMKTLFEAGTATFEGYHVTKDGKKVPIEANSHLFEIGDKKRIITAARDISERKKQERGKESFANIVEKADVGTVVTDLEGNIISFNKTAKRLFGEKIKEEENFGLHFSFDEKTEVNIIKKGGNIGKGIMTSAKTMWQGEAACLIFIRDITKQKEAEEKIKEQVKKLEKLDEMRTQFLSMASHELKTPLTPIKAQLQMLQKSLEREDYSKDKSGKSLEVVLRNVNRLNRLVDDILDISRVESGKMIIERKKQDLKKTIKNSAETVSAEDVKIEIDIKKIPKIPFDKDRISQVLINLIENAIKHGKAKKIKIIVGKKKDNIKVEVRDNGEGISKRNLESVFEPFERERGKKLAPGTGLGLSISRRIISAHGGEIWAESNKKGKERGTSVFFTLPLEKTEPKEAGFSDEIGEKTKSEIEDESKKGKKSRKEMKPGKINKKEVGLNIKHQKKEKKSGKENSKKKSSNKKSEKK